ncbi:MAG: hypothetical protein PHY02_00540 [Phycisphaerae bacterium]|nr:hypothetical protein [Phycisphaerae bacterium]
MGMKEDITKRFDELINHGRGLIGTLGPELAGISGDGHKKYDNNRYEYWVPQKRVSEFRAWLTSASNLTHFVAPPETHLAKECDDLMADEHLKQGVPSNVLVLMLGVLKGVKDEWDHGLLGRIEYIVAGATFDDFLDYAAEYHKGNKKIESSVLASAVLEDTVKKIAQKNGLATERKTLDPLIDELVKANVFTPVKAKRVRSFAGVRNHALHAEWDKFDNSDVGAMIKGIRELIEELL